MAVGKNAGVVAFDRIVQEGGADLLVDLFLRREMRIPGIERPEAVVEGETLPRNKEEDEGYQVDHVNKY